MTGAAPQNAGRLYPDRPILAASLAVFRGDRVLLARRPAAPLAGRFTLPGGMVELGESLETAAVREVAEEVGVEASVIGFNRHVELVERDDGGRVRRHYLIASFVGAWIAGEGSTGPEASAVVWATRAEVGGLETTEHLLPLLDAAWTIAAEARNRCRG